MKGYVTYIEDDTLTKQGSLQTDGQELETWQNLHFAKTRWRLENRDRNNPRSRPDFL